MKKEACSVNKTICIILILLTLQIILLSCRGISVIEDGSNPETAEETAAKTVTDKETPDITDKTEIADNTDHRFDWQYDVPLYYPEEEEIQGDYIFNSSENGSVDLVLKRNVHTGECTTVCNDPFCTHDNPSCRFYISLYVVGIGNTVYGIRTVEDNGSSKMTNYIYSYNVDTDEYKIVFEKDEPVHIEELYSYGKYLFFYVSGKDAGIKRFDTVSGELEKVNKQGTLSTLRDGMIIWSKGSNSYVATDLLGNDPKPYDPMIYNGYLHKNELVNRMFITIYRISKNGTDEKKLFENALFPVRVNNYMFYYGVFDDMEQHPIFPDRPEGGTTLCNGDIYIMPLDTEEVRLLCHVDGVSLHMDNSAQNHFVCGDWKGFIISPTKQFVDKTGYEVTDNDMVIVNVKTGEYHISRYIE